jgi:hypothetical protein
LITSFVDFTSANAAFILSAAGSFKEVMQIIDGITLAFLMEDGKISVKPRKSN